MAICHGSFLQLNVAAFFAEVIFHGFLLWEFAAAICK